MEVLIRPDEFGKLTNARAGLIPHQRRQIKNHPHAFDQQQTVHRILDRVLQNISPARIAQKVPWCDGVAYLACSGIGAPRVSIPSMH